MKPTSWLSRLKVRNSAVSSASPRRASALKASSPVAVYKSHSAPGQKPPVHQLLPSKGAGRQALPSPP